MRLPTKGRLALSLALGLSLATPAVAQPPPPPAPTAAPRPLSESLSGMAKAEYEAKIAARKDELRFGCWFNVGRIAAHGLTA